MVIAHFYLIILTFFSQNTHLHLATQFADTFIESELASHKFDIFLVILSLTFLSEF